LLPGIHVFLGCLKAKSSAAETAAGNVDPASIKRAHGDLEPVTFLANQIRGGDAEVVKSDQSGGLDGPSHFLLFLTVGDALCVAGHDEGRNILF
jgi:hypothetical protein